MLVLFEDLIFEAKPLGGIGATHTFNNGVTISVQASKGSYSKPREDLKSPNDFCSFEIAMWNKDGEWVTKNFVPNNNDNVAGWQDRSQINALMLSLQCTEMWEYLQSKLNLNK